MPRRLATALAIVGFLSGAPAAAWRRESGNAGASTSAAAAESGSGTAEGGAALRNCPAEVALAGKDQCLDVETNDMVPMECCLEIQACRDDLTGLQSAYLMPLAQLTQGCALSQEDMAQLTKGDVAHLDMSKACAAQCLGAVEEARAGGLPDFEGFRGRCRENLMLRDAQMLEAVEAQRTMVTAFLALARQCGAPSAELPAPPPPPPRDDEQKKKGSDESVVQVRSHCVSTREAMCPWGFQEVQRGRCILYLHRAPQMNPMVSARLAPSRIFLRPQRHGLFHVKCQKVIL
mmetsp:Transcript_120375/g.300291  ORF Transcript_120375/g.300291 Transcript_120375/m.300291 type:complete len:290 (-) Transcript_120375:38-907(-)